MMGKNVKLGEVAEFNPRAPSLKLEDYVSIVPMASVSEVSGSITISQEATLREVKTGLTPFRRNDILVAKITPCFENNKIAQANIAHDFGFGSTEFHVIRPSEKLDARFVFHFLRRDVVRSEGQRNMTGSAGQRRVPKLFLQNLEIPLPPLAEQERIASLLDAADRLRAQRRDALRRLDALTRSLFLDTFGDPAHNPKNWPVVNLGIVCKIERNGIDPAKIETGTKYVGLENIIKGGAFKDVQAVSNGDLASTKFVFGPHHVLYGKLRPYLAKIALPNFEGVCSTDILPLLPSAKLNRGYLLHFLRSPDMVELANSRSSGANLPRLSPRSLAEFEIPLPPLPLQLEFATRLEQIEGLRARMERSALELDGLFASLQSAAFGA